MFFKQLTLFFCCLSYSLLSYCQQDELVSLFQKNSKHHIKLFAVNHAPDSKKILIKLDATGFRRKVFRPIFKTIKANDTLLITTLVKRSNTGLKLNYDLLYDARLELYLAQQSKKNNAKKKRTQ